MSKIEKFVLGKGVTEKIESGKGFAIKRKYLELDVKLPAKCSEKDFQVALARAEYTIDTWIEQSEVPKIPKLDMAVIDGLPWKKANKESAEPHEFGWLFGPESVSGTEAGAENLVAAIDQTSNGLLVLGNMQYSLSKEGAFIQRKPIKGKQ